MKWNLGCCFGPNARFLWCFIGAYSALVSLFRVVCFPSFTGCRWAFSHGFSTETSCAKCRVLLFSIKQLWPRNRELLLPSVCPGRRTHGAKMDFAWLYRRAGHSVFRQHAACLAFCRQAPLFLFCEFQRVQKAFPLLYRGRTNLFAQKNSGYRFFCNRC